MKACIIIAIACVAAWIVYLMRRVDLKRYNSKFAVVTGATGGCGEEYVRQLSQQMQVIMIDRDQGRLSLLKEKFGNKVFQFAFDFNDDLNEFAPRFDRFLAENGIEKNQIGLCVSNAGHGEYSAFHETDFKRKNLMVQVNFQAHVCMADYFMKIFMKRRDSKLKSGFVFMSSAEACSPMFQWSLYDSTKAGLSALSNALFAEYKFKGIDVLAVQPGAIKNTQFFKHENMTSLKSFEKVVNLFALQPKAVVNQTFQRIGKVSTTQVGFYALSFALLSCLGRNFNGLMWSIVPVVREALWVPLNRKFKIFE